MQDSYMRNERVLMTTARSHLETQVGLIALRISGLLEETLSLLPTKVAHKQ